MRHKALVFRCSIVGLALGASAFASTLSMSDAVVTQPALVPTQRDLQQEAVSLGLSPQNLCVIGLNADQTSDLIATAIESIEENWSTLKFSRSSILSYSTEVAVLKQAVRGGTATQEDHDGLLSAQSSLDTAKASLENTVSLMQTDINQHLSLEQSTNLARLVANAGLPVPVKYHILDKTSVEWVHFRKAYAQCQTNENPSSEASGIVQAADSQYEVNLAQVHLDTYLDAVSEAFENAFDAE